MDIPARKRLGEILIERGKLDAAGLDRALRLQQETGEKLGALLVTLGLCAQRDVAEALAAQLGLPLVETAGYPEFPILEERVSTRFLRETRTLPVREDETELALAMVDPTDEYTIGAFRMVTGRAVKPLVAIPTDFEAAFERLYGTGRTAMGQIVGDIETRGDELAFDADVQHLKDLASEAPVIRLVWLVITHALETRASDIHIEPFENRLIVRYRIDGVLHEVESPPRRFSAAVISRIKIMANLDIAERRLPQDGRIQLRVQGKEIDLRVSTVPTMHGESVVMRILDKGGVALDFTTLGFEDDTLADLPRRRCCSRTASCWSPGPRAAARRRRSTRRSTAAQQARRQDPHRRGPGRVPDAGHQPDPGQAADRPDLRQRAALDRAPGPGRDHDRRDPRPRDGADRRAVGADRPPGAVDAAHQRRGGARSTACSTWAMEDYLLTSTVIGILAQRLVRTLCPQCREPTRPCRRWSPKWAAPLRRAGQRRHAVRAGGLRRPARRPASSAASASWRSCR